MENNQSGEFVQVGLPEGMEPQVSSPGKTQAIFGIISGVIALLFFPPIFGITGMVLGSKAKARGEIKLGNIAFYLSLICMIVGFYLGVLAYRNNMPVTFLEINKSII